MAKDQPANPWLEPGRRPFHWAHQGGAREAPSNTLRAMRTGRDRGAHGLELDVHASSDGRVVVIHDHTLHRTTNRSGWVGQHMAEELAGFDAAYWWVPGKVDNHDKDRPARDYPLRGDVDKEPDLAIPTLDDILARHAGVPMTIEIKHGDAVAPLLELLAEHRIPNENLIVTAFDDRVVDELHTLAPDLPLAPARRWTLRFLIYARLRLPLPRRGAFVAVQVPHHRAWREIIPAPVGTVLPKRWKLTVVTPRFVRAAHKAGLAVHVWTIDDEGEMRRLLDMGVDGIMTDCPSALRRVLAERGGH